ncbi:MAG: M48 family metallopeptidase [Acidobacteria bacterium]|nr:M48 family metallopeptidase [Acidobacteriota bacterium]
MLPTLLLSLVLTVSSSEAVTSADQAPEQPAAAASAAVDETQPVEVPPPTEKALQYHASGNILWAVEQAWSFLILIVLLATGLSARLRDWSQRIGRKWFFTLAVYFILFTIITSVVDLPRAYYVEFVRQHAYGLSNQTLQKWWTDTLTSLGVACVIGPLVIWVPYLLLRKSPTRWWLYSAVALIPFIIAGNLIAPIWIAPLFNRFEPMQDKALETRILALADRAGIDGSRVFQVNKSVDTKTLNAYVAGMFGTKRIVLWDTIIRRMNERELMFVMGHEMGHYALGHTWQLIALSSFTIMLSFYVAYRTAGAVLARYSARFGFASLSDIASLPLLLALTGVFSFVTTPFENAFTRHVEHEADRFGLEITQTNHSAAAAFVKLQTDVLGVPRPGLLYKIWRESHPPLGERIDFANDYHPWRSGQPLVYGDVFKR